MLHVSTYRLNIPKVNNKVLEAVREYGYKSCELVLQDLYLEPSLYACIYTILNVEDIELSLQQLISLTRRCHFSNIREIVISRKTIDFKLLRLWLENTRHYKVNISITNDYEMGITTLYKIICRLDSPKIGIYFNVDKAKYLGYDLQKNLDLLLDKTHLVSISSNVQELEDKDLYFEIYHNAYHRHIKVISTNYCDENTTYFIETHHPISKGESSFENVLE